LIASFFIVILAILCVNFVCDDDDKRIVVEAKMKCCCARFFVSRVSVFELSCASGWLRVVRRRRQTQKCFCSALRLS
jgi:hypothetical protein